MKRQRWNFSAARMVGCFALIAATSLWTFAPAPAVTLTDNFDDVQDYSFGPGPSGPNEPWSGMENLPGLLGTGVYDSSTTNAGTLTVEDNGTFDADGDPNNGISGTGWEGGRSTSPFLFTDVPAGQDFTATVKISAQTSGFWSAAGIIARAANSPTPPGIGADHADENFTTVTSFRTDAANNAEGNTLQKRIEAGAQLNDNNFVINSASTEPFPILLRMERVGGGATYRAWVSTDGGATYQFQSRVRPTAGNALRDAAVGMQVGLSYMNFGTLAGTAQFDDFVLDTYDPLPAPGAPVLPTMVEVNLIRGHLLTLPISDMTGVQGPLQWTLTADGTNPPAPPPNLNTIRVLPALLPGGQGGQAAPTDALGDPIAPFPPPGSTNFRWNTDVAMNTNAMQNPLMLPPTPWTKGTYGWTIRATNDWLQVSNDMRLIVHLVPEPAAIAFAGFVIAWLVGVRRRR